LNRLLVTTGWWTDADIYPLPISSNHFRLPVNVDTIRGLLIFKWLAGSFEKNPRQYGP